MKEGRAMRDHTWWKHFHWPEYGAELLGTAFLVFAGVSAVVFVFGTGSPLAQILPDSSSRRLIAGLLVAGWWGLVAIFAPREAQWWSYQSCRIASILDARED